MAEPQSSRKPSIGSILSTIPIVIGFAVFDGWTKLVLVLSLVIAIEFVIGFVLEPLLYGRWQAYGAYRLDRARSTMLRAC